MLIDLSEGTTPEDCETMDIELDDDMVERVQKLANLNELSFEETLKDLLLRLFEDLKKDDGGVEGEF